LVLTTQLTSIEIVGGLPSIWGWTWTWSFSAVHVLR